jgi:hypothetical protein
VEKQRWAAAEVRAEGGRVKDDVKLLNRAMKRKEAKKRKVISPVYFRVLVCVCCACRCMACMCARQCLLTCMHMCVCVCE